MPPSWVAPRIPESPAARPTRTTAGEQREDTYEVVAAAVLPSQCDRAATPISGPAVCTPENPAAQGYGATAGDNRYGKGHGTFAGSDTEPRNRTYTAAESPNSASTSGQRTA